MGGWVIPLIKGASTIGTGLMGFQGQRETNRANERIAKNAQNFDLKMWNLQNEYNAPRSQMARLKEANLNPNLIYGSGNVSGNISSAPPKGREYEYNSPTPNLSQVLFPDPLTILSEYQNYRRQEVEIDNTQNVSEYNKQKAINEALRAPNIEADTALKNASSKQKSELTPYQMAMLKSQIDLQNKRTADLAFKLYRLNPLSEQGLILKNKQSKWQLDEMNFLNSEKARHQIGSIKQDKLNKQLQFVRDSQLAPYSMSSKDKWLYKMFVKTLDDISNSFKPSRNPSDLHGGGGSW